MMKVTVEEWDIKPAKNVAKLKVSIEVTRPDGLIFVATLDNQYINVGDSFFPVAFNISSVWADYPATR